MITTWSDFFGDPPPQPHFVKYPFQNNDSITREPDEKVLKCTITELGRFDSLATKTRHLILARISQSGSSRSGGSADLTRRATEAPASVLSGTLRRPTERKAVRADDSADAVESVRECAGPTCTSCLIYRRKRIRLRLWP